jgi:hypothetical protein
MRLRSRGSVRLADANPAWMMLSAVLVTGDVGYEPRLDCRSFAEPAHHVTGLPV